MVTPTSDIGGHPATRPTSPDTLRHRLDVIAATTEDVVRNAGGCLFDRVMAGWDVTVSLPRGCDARPLHILGAQVLDSQSQRFTSEGQSLAVSAEAFGADDSVGRLVRTALANRFTEVALWGQGWPLGLDRRLATTRYQLSAAARVFKAQALRAAGIVSVSIDPAEVLLTDSWLG